MREAYLGGCGGDAKSGHTAARPAADWLGLAAAPTFAIMALLTSVGGQPDILCAAASPLNGMTAMYLLMSAFHARPWLTLIAGRRNGARRGVAQPRLDLADSVRRPLQRAPRCDI